MLELRNVCKSFEGRQILKNITIDFEQGKTNLIIGKSGSGKTVLLKSIVGLHQVDEGEIFYDERNFTKMSPKEKKVVRKEIGMVFQGGALFDSSTVEENVQFPLDMFTDMTEEQKKFQVNFCLKRVNLINANHLFPSQISGGMQKRVAIARAIALNPRYLFCDEPNSGLDPHTSTVIDNLIAEITQEFNITTVINTHDMNSVAEIGDKILFLHLGEKCWVGHKSQIFDCENEHLNDLIFATNLMKKLKKK